MSWYWWVLIWVVVLFLALGVLVLIGRSLFGKAKELARELGTATDRLSQASQGLQDLAERQSDPAVFTSASRLRQERFLEARHRGERPGSGQTGQMSRPGTGAPQSARQRVR